LAKDRPEFAALLRQREKALAEDGRLNLEPPRLPDAPLGGRRLLKPESREARIGRLVERMRPRALHLKYPPDAKAPGGSVGALGLGDLWDICTQDVDTPWYYPRWSGDLSQQCPHPRDRAWWWTAAYPESNDAALMAYFRGDGKSDEDFCAHTATFWWYFVAEQTERLQAFVDFRLAGPCTYRQNSGDVALWVLPSVEVKKGWSADWNQLQTVFSQPRWLNKWLATYDGPFVDGDVPQGAIDLSFHPTPNDYFALNVTQGERYIISVNVQIALLNTYNGVLMLGAYSGTPPYYTIDSCVVSGDCVLCLCA
jgi:hypothetical protein